jgi:hypothetical protein
LISLSYRGLSKNRVLGREFLSDSIVQWILLVCA